MATSVRPCSCASSRRFFSLRPQLPFWARWTPRRFLGHGTVWRTIHVEIVRHDEWGLGVGCGRNAVFGKHRQHVRPLLVGDVQAVVDDGSIRTGSTRFRDIGAVGRDDLDSFWKAGSSTAADGTDGEISVDELIDDGTTGAAGGTENDVEGSIRRHGTRNYSGEEGTGASA